MCSTERRKVDSKGEKGRARGRETLLLRANLRNVSETSSSIEAEVCSAYEGPQAPWRGRGGGNGGRLDQETVSGLFVVNHPSEGSTGAQGEKFMG